MLLNKLIDILPIFFWSFLIFGFENTVLGIASILCALIHEAGHMLYIFAVKGNPNRIRGVASGFRIKAGKGLSYNQEILMYLAGPMSNILLFVLLSLPCLIAGRPITAFAIISLVTGLSNLLPIKGYDGYGIIRAVIEKYTIGDRAILTLLHLSSALSFIFCLIAIYFLDRLGEGYWIFALFFVSMIKHIKEGLGA